MAFVLVAVSVSVILLRPSKNTKSNLFSLPLGDYKIHKFHEAQFEKFWKFGKIVRESKLQPGQNLVHVFDSADMETIYRYEGKHPIRDFFKGMAAIRKTRPDLYHTAGVAAG